MECGQEVVDARRATAEEELPPVLHRSRTARERRTGGKGWRKRWTTDPPMAVLVAGRR